MQQVKVSLEPSQVEFLDRHEQLGFKDKSSVVRAALSLLIQELESRRLRESAELYGEIYSTDTELQELTEDALVDWPE
jgi:Arc/MetJ-type ribon-helix-helix transcriptional regulator